MLCGAVLIESVGLFTDFDEAVMLLLGRCWTFWLAWNAWVSEADVVRSNSSREFAILDFAGLTSHIKVGLGFNLVCREVEMLRDALRKVCWVAEALEIVSTWLVSTETRCEFACQLWLICHPWRRSWCPRETLTMSLMLSAKFLLLFQYLFRREGTTLL